MVLIAVVLALGEAVWGVSPSADERTEMQHWAETHLSAAASSFPFSFSYDGRPFAELAPSWRVKESVTPLDSVRTEHTLVWTSPSQEVEIRCQSIQYSDYPVVEWLVLIKNNSEQDSGVFENIQGVDLLLPFDGNTAATLHHGRGSQAKSSDFADLREEIVPGAEIVFASHGGGGKRGGSPSVESLPFFEIETASQGTIFGLGWTGPWKARVVRNAGGAMRVIAGLETVHLRLHPGEEVRGMRVAMLSWKGDTFRAHNLWRRFIFAHYSPMPGGKPFNGLITDSSWGNWMPANRHIEEMNWWRDHDLPMECYWVDAGWTDMSLGWPAHQSQQVPNKDLFPDGMKPLSDAAHARGMKFLLWMVPQSVHPEVGIGKVHPEWLGEPFGGPEYGDMIFHGLDMGKPEVIQHMIDHFSKVIRDFSVDVFRQDGGNLWPEDKNPDRIGASSMHYIQGSYDFWDGLLKNHPNLLIDNCAEGGRKIDLETIKRSIVLWRSDWQCSSEFDPTFVQGFTYGLLPWTPLCGGTVLTDKLTVYGFRSAYCPALQMAWAMKPVPNLQDRWANVDLDLLRRLLNEYIILRPYLFGDFYPLTPYSTENTDWLVWQFDRPDLGEGLVQAFRRSNCDAAQQTFALHGLDAAVPYTVENVDEKNPARILGQSLMEQGISITLNEKPGAAIVTYKKRK